MQKKASNQLNASLGGIKTTRCKTVKLVIGRIWNTSNPGIKEKSMQSR